MLSMDHGIVRTKRKKDFVMLMCKGVEKDASGLYCVSSRVDVNRSSRHNDEEQQEEVVIVVVSFFVVEDVP